MQLHCALALSPAAGCSGLVMVAEEAQLPSYAHVHVPWIGMTYCALMH